MISKLGSGIRVALAALAVGCGLLAQTNTWDGDTSTSWDEGANWSQGVPPTAAHAVVIPSAAGTMFDPSTSGAAGATCSSLTVQSNGLLDIAAGFPLGISGSATINAGGSVTSSESFICGQALTVNGTLTTSGSSVQTTNTLTIGSVGSLQATSATSLIVGGNLSMNGGPLNAPMAVLTANAGVSIFGGTLTLGSGVHRIKGALVSDVSTVTILGKILFDGPSGVVSFGALASLPDVDVDVGGGTFSLSTCKVTGTFRLLSGTLLVSGSPLLQGPAIFQGGSYSGGQLTLGPGSTTFTGTTATGAVNLVVKGPWTSDLSFNPASGAIQFAGGTNQSVTVADAAWGFGGVGSTVNVTINTATSIQTSLPIEVGGALVLGGAGAGTLTTTGSPVQVNGAVTVNSNGSLQAANAASLVIGGNLSMQGGPVNAPLAELTANLDVLIASGTLTLGSGVHRIKRALVSDVSTVTILGKILFDGSSGVLSFGALAPLPDVDVNVSGTFALSTCQVTGTFRLLSGNTVASGSPLLQGPAIFQGGSYSGGQLTLGPGSTTFTGTTVTGAVDLLIKGPWTSDLSFNPVSGAIRFAGGTNQSVTVADAAWGFGGVGSTVNVTINTATSIQTSLPIEVGGALVLGGAGAGTLTTTGSSVQVNGAVTVNSNGSLQAANAASLVIGGNLNMQGGPVNAPLAELTANLDVLIASGTLTLGSGVHRIKGALVSDVSTVTILGKILFDGPSGVVSFGALASLPDVDVDVGGGTFSLSTCKVTGTFRLLSGNLAVSGSPLLQGPAIFQGGNYNSSSVQLNLEGSSTTFSGTTASGAVNLLVKGSWTSDGNFMPASGTVTLSATGAQLVMLTGGHLPTVVVTSSSAATFVNSGPGSASIQGNLTAAAGSTLAFGAVAYQVCGTFTSSGALIVNGNLLLKSTVSTTDAATISGTLSGTGLIDCDEPLVLSAIATASPDLQLSKNLTFNGSLYSPTSGCVIFDGTAPQTVSLSAGSAIAFYCLDLRANSDVTFNDDLHVLSDSTWDGTGNVQGYADFDGDFEGTDGGAILITGTGGVEWSGGRIAYPGILIPGGTININTPGSVVVNVPNGFDVQVDVGIAGLLTIENDTLVIGGDLNILSGTVVSDGDLVLTADSIVIESAGTLDALGNRLELRNGVPVTVRGRLEVGAGGNLVLATSAIDVQSGGALSLVGLSPNSRARISGNGIGGWSVEIRSGAMFEAGAFRVQEMGTGGIDVDIGASLGAFPLDVRDGIFDLIEAGGVYLEIDRPTNVFVQLDDLQFKDSDMTGRTNPGTKNVRVSTASAPVSFEGWSGEFGGPRFEEDGGPMDNFALWGSQIAFMVVREHTAQHDVFWRTTFEDAPVTFKVERAPAMAGSFVQIGSDVMGVGPSLYVVSDNTITPTTPYRYRLREVLFNGPPVITKVIKTVLVDGVSNPATIPGSGSGPISPLPLVGPNGSGGTSGGKLKKARLDDPVREVHDADPSLQGVLDAALANEGERWIEIELPAGRHGAFTFAPSGRQNLRITASPGEPAVIDVSEAPIRIRGLGPRQSVELSGFALASGDSRRPALVIEECEGIVLLDRLEVRGKGPSGVRLADASAVVLQNVRLPELAPLELERSTAWCRRGRIEALRLSEGSSLESWGLDAFSDVDATSQWRAHRAKAAELTLEEVEGELFLTVEGAPGKPWLGFASLRLRNELVPDGLPMLLLENPRMLNSPRALGPDGRDQLALSLPASVALLDRPLYFQAVLSPDEGPITTPVRSFRLGRQE